MKSLNAITSKLNKKDPPTSCLETDSETDSEAESIAERYPYTGSDSDSDSGED